VSFDRVARFYRLLETMTFRNALQRARTRWSSAVASPKRALILGEGNGRFLSEFAMMHLDTRIDCVDASEVMLEMAKESLMRTSPAALQRVRFIQADIRQWAPADSYDLIVTHFFLDCFDEAEIRSIVQKIANATEKEATWLVADFTVPPGLGAVWARLWLAAMYCFFRVTAGLETSRLIDPSPCLTEAGFVLVNDERSRNGMLKTQMWRRSV
jgi:ubiquinone/menaquinone biosynthesis C-methylase UbiE